MATKLESVKDAENVEADKELLEYAARAVGKGTFWQSENPCLSSAPYWNPITNDGDALRLAVKLGIDIFPWQDKHNDRHDLYAATRLAIVRAAADIGKKIK